MNKNWLIVLFVLIVLVALYFIEISKIDTGRGNSMPTLDHLQTDEVSESWAPFYKVRATIIDGQSASFSIPKKIKDNEGKEIQLTGAMVFRSNGCEFVDDNTIRVNYFFLLPSLGLADACEIQPSISMRWTIRVNLATPVILTRVEMMDAEAKVSGIFNIDTSKPYEAAFIIENATAELKMEND